MDIYILTHTIPNERAYIISPCSSLENAFETAKKVSEITFGFTVEKDETNPRMFNSTTTKDTFEVVILRLDGHLNE